MSLSAAPTQNQQMINHIAQNLATNVKKRMTLVEQQREKQRDRER
jgi:hypothetical protein